jgi:F-type H+-transporting ATPase subunit b
MLIDWFTVAAQMVNFLILAWLLKRFLYRPVLKALDEREKKIADELNGAELVRQEAAREKKEWQQKNSDFEQQRALILTRAGEEGEERRQTLLEQARKEYGQLQENLQESLRRQRADLDQESSLAIRSEAFSVAGKILQELAGVSIEARMVQLFCERLRKAGVDEIGDMIPVPGDTALPAVVRSGFALGQEERMMITNTVMELISPDTRLSFETTENLLCGVKLSMNGRSISWNFSDALAAIRNKAEQPVEKA